MTPALSVVMPAHNARPFVDQSVASILAQSFSDFEFVILDDASTDGTRERLHEWETRDARIRVFEIDRQLGLVGSSNLVISLSRTPIIARMDADDLSHPDRLSQQWSVLLKNPEISLVGTLFDGIDVEGRTVRPRDRWRIIRRSSHPPFPHGSVMFRRAAFDAVGGYRKEFTGAEDQDLFLRMAARGRAVTLPDILYHYRYHTSNATISNNSMKLDDLNAPEEQTLSASYLLAAMRLWSGDRPPALNLRGTAARWNLTNARMLFYTWWGGLHPASLRATLRTLIRIRDFLASIRIRDGRPYEWRFE